MAPQSGIWKPKELGAALSFGPFTATTLLPAPTTTK